MEVFRQLDQIKLLSKDFKILFPENGDFSIPKVWSIVAIAPDGLILSGNNAIIFTKFDNVYKIKSSRPPIEGEINGKEIRETE